MAKPGAYSGDKAPTKTTPPLSPFVEEGTGGAGGIGDLRGLTPAQQKAFDKLVNRAKKLIDRIAKKLRKEEEREKKGKKKRKSPTSDSSLSQQARKFVNKKAGSILKTTGQRERMKATVYKIWKHGSRAYQRVANTSFFPGRKTKQ